MRNVSWSGPDHQARPSGPHGQLLIVTQFANCTSGNHRSCTHVYIDAEALLEGNCSCSTYMCWAPYSTVQAELFTHFRHAVLSNTSMCCS